LAEENARSHHSQSKKQNPEILTRKNPVPNPVPAPVDTESAKIKSSSTLTIKQSGKESLVVF
jgi:hypothetical protein